ncbi:hypothetical protein NE237_005151 [Protea cynaroides]|uniref:Uncharacterized protein n=1 Tax=Protea cynaroides TaxID=273540 RepID=A0A9Q0KK31_9MAGN|nr:hypothetical protein NE237_005151 [Protea cynaroides]
MMKSTQDHNEEIHRISHTAMDGKVAQDHEEEIHIISHIAIDVIHQQAQGDGYVQVNAQDIGLEGGAKTNNSLKINQIINETTAWGHRWGPQSYVEQKRKEEAAPPLWRQKEQSHHCCHKEEVKDHRSKQSDLNRPCDPTKQICMSSTNL